MDISIIIVNWNSIDYLRECISSIYEYTSRLFEIIVVDNASPAGDAASLERESCRFNLIKSEVNLGFAGANNLGFRNSSGKYILFLNPDTKLVSPAIDQMLQAMETVHDAGILGCTLLNEDLSVQTSCIQTFPTILNQLLDSDWLRRRLPNSKLWGTWPIYQNDEKLAKVEVISGACMLVQRQVFEQAGLFSEEYFMYAEDLDLCYKVKSHGRSNYYLGTTRLVHYGGKSSNFEKATQMKWKSIVQFCEKHRGGLYALFFRIVMAFAAFGRLLTIAGMGILRTTSGAPEPSRSSFVKWKIVLRAVLTPRRRLPHSRNENRGVPECGTSHS